MKLYPSKRRSNNFVDFASYVLPYLKLDRKKVKAKELCKLYNIQIKGGDKD